MCRLTASNINLAAMILSGTAKNLGRTNAHTDWLSRFQAIPQADQAQENSQMADIIGLFPTEKSCKEAKLAACVNNEETTIFLGLHASKENFFLVHNLEVLPKSRHQKKLLIRALHGFGESATVIILDFDEVFKRNEIHSASISSIRNFARHAKISDTTFISSLSLLTCRGLVALPLFISSKLMVLPDLAVNHVLSILLQSIANCDKKSLEQASVDPAKKEAGKKMAKEEKPAIARKLLDNPIKEILSSEEGETFSSDEDKQPLNIWAAAKKASAEKANEPSAKTAPSSEKASAPKEKTKSKLESQGSHPRHPVTASVASSSAFCGPPSGSSVSQTEAKTEATKRSPSSPPSRPLSPSNESTSPGASSVTLATVSGRASSTKQLTRPATPQPVRPQRRAPTPSTTINCCQSTSKASSKRSRMPCSASSHSTKST
jgi:hypothetical protein